MSNTNFIPPGLHIDNYTNNFVIDEVVMALSNIGIHYDRQGYNILKLDTSDSSKLASGALNEIFKNNASSILNIEVQGKGSPDVTVMISECTINENGSGDVHIHSKNGQDIFGFEHFRIGSNYKNKRLTLLQFLDESVYKDPYFKLKVLRSNPSKRLNEIKQLGNCVNPCSVHGTYSELLDSFRDSYTKHYKKIARYINGIDKTLKNREVHQVVRKESIWFIIENIDSGIFQRTKNNEITEIPFILTDEALNIMYNVKKMYNSNSSNNTAIDIGGIVYIGFTGPHVVSAELINKCFRCKTYKPYNFYYAQDAYIETRFTQDADNGNIVEYYMVIDIHRSNVPYKKLIRLEFQDKQKVLHNVDNTIKQYYSENRH